MKGTRQDEEWTLEKLEFRPEGATDWIDLLEESDATASEVDSLSVRVNFSGGDDAQRRRSSR